MHRPTNEQLAQALAHAEGLRVSDADPFHVARSLLYLHQRNALLEQVARAARDYVHFGLTPTHHADLVLALDALKRHEDGEASPGLGVI